MVSRKLLVRICDLTDILSSLSKMPLNSSQDVYVVPSTDMSFIMTDVDPLVIGNVHLVIGFDSNKEKLNTLSVLNLTQRAWGWNDPPQSLLFRVCFTDGDLVDIGRLDSARQEPFHLHPESSITLAKFGTTGCRAVWLEENMETNEERIVKLSLDPSISSTILSTLLPPAPELPFKPSECRSIAFDDVMGRLCIGLYNGHIYVLDFS